MKTSIAILAAILLVCNASYAGDGVQKTMDIVNEQGVMSGMTFISGDSAFMYISGALDSHEWWFWNDISILKSSTKIRGVEVVINSPGGRLDTALALVDMINGAEKDGFKFKAYGRGMVASAALAVFVAFDERVIGESCVFMVHEASSNFEGSTSDQRAHRQMVELMTTRYYEILIRETEVKDLKKWREWEAKTEWFNAKTALKRGVAQRIE